MNIAQTALEIAQSQIGVREVPPGSNKGPEVSSYLKSVGLGPGYSWCMAFVYWCYLQAAIKLKVTSNLVKTGGVMDAWNRAAMKRKVTAIQARKNPALIKPGNVMILLIDPHTGAGHTGIVESIDGVNLTTIEGNSNNGGSREGIGVFKLTRRKLTDKSLVGFLQYPE